MAERGLSLKWVENAIAEPDWTEPDPAGEGIERRFLSIEEFGGRVLRVVCMETVDEIRVITATFDRNARRRSR